MLFGSTIWATTLLLCALFLFSACFFKLAYFLALSCLLSAGLSFYKDWFIFSASLFFLTALI